MEPKPGFQHRIFISLLLTMAAAALVVSGVAVYIKPEGSVARALGWTFLGLSKGDWEAVHTTVSLCFVLVAAVHLGLNWGAFRHHLRRACARAGGARREGLLALIVLVLVVGLTLASVPPLRSIVDFGDRIKEAWKSRVEEARDDPLDS